MIRRTRPGLTGLALALCARPGAAFAASGAGIDIATNTVQKIVSLLTGDLATAALLLVIVLCGIAWWLMRSSRAGEILGRTVVGAVIIFGAAQFSEYFGFTGAVL